MIPSLPSQVWVSIFITILSLCIGFGVRYVVPGLSDDNEIEELCEEMIQKETGIAIDLTPQSPEKDS